MDKSNNNCTRQVPRIGLELCISKRGIQEQITYTGTRGLVVFKLPLNEVVFDFYDRLKSITKGYASFDYEITGYEIHD